MEKYERTYYIKLQLSTDDEELIKEINECINDIGLEQFEKELKENIISELNRMIGFYGSKDFAKFEMIENPIE